MLTDEQWVALEPLIAACIHQQKAAPLPKASNSSDSGPENALAKRSHEDIDKSEIRLVRATRSIQNV